MKRRGFYQYVKKGSYTVEATVIMGAAFLVLAAVLYVGSFWYGRACLTASAYEMAFTGRIQEEYGLFGFERIERECSFEEKKRTVSYRAVCRSAWGGLMENVEIQAEVKQLQPVTFIWNCDTVVP